MVVNELDFLLLYLTIFAVYYVVLKVQYRIFV